MLCALLATWLATAIGPPPDRVAPAPATGAPAAVAPLRVALVPLENLSPVSAARDVLGDAVAAELTRRGLAVARGAPVEAFLRGRRIRHVDSLQAD